VKLVDTPDLGSGGFGRGGSTPSARTSQLHWMGLKTKSKRPAAGNRRWIEVYERHGNGC
jgi:hypothetical protein